MSAPSIPRQLLPHAENNPELTAILTQHGAIFVRIMLHQSIDYRPNTVVEFPFATILLGNPTISEAQEKWPELRGQRADLVNQVVHACEQWQTTRAIVGEHHTVVQSMIMRALIRGCEPNMLFGCVETSRRTKAKENWSAFPAFVKWAYQMRPY